MNAKELKEDWIKAFRNPLFCLSFFGEIGAIVLMLYMILNGWNLR